jgi:long-chain acyl-CoA synthetase
LKKLGLSKGETVGVILNNCTEWFICEQAVHGLGGVFVPMYLQELPKVMKYICTDAGMKFLFARDKSIYEKVKDFKNDVPTLQEIFVVYGEGENSMNALEEMGKKNPAPSIKPAWSDMASIVYTSGTTGDPKGVELSQGSLTLNGRLGLDSFGINETMHIVAILPWAHVYGLATDLHLYIAAGGGIAFAESVEKLIQNFQEVKPTGLCVVPKIVNKVYDTIQMGVAADPTKKMFFDAAVAEAIKNRDLTEKYFRRGSEILRHRQCNGQTGNRYVLSRYRSTDLRWLRHDGNRTGHYRKYSQVRQQIGNCRQGYEKHACGDRQIARGRGQQRW